MHLKIVTGKESGERKSARDKVRLFWELRFLALFPRLKRSKHICRFLAWRRRGKGERARIFYFEASNPTRISLRIKENQHFSRVIPIFLHILLFPFSVLLLSRTYLLANNRYAGRKFSNRAISLHASSQKATRVRVSRASEIKRKVKRYKQQVVWNTGRRKKKDRRFLSSATTPEVSFLFSFFVGWRKISRGTSRRARRRSANFSSMRRIVYSRGDVRSSERAGERAGTVSSGEGSLCSSRAEVLMWLMSRSIVLSCVRLSTSTTRQCERCTWIAEEYVARVRSTSTTAIETTTTTATNILDAIH